MTIDGQPWFVAADVCAFTEHSNVTMALRSLDASEKAQFNLGNRPTNIVSEAGLYRLVMRARKRKPAITEFQTWVTGTVLPAIRKDGMYVQGEEKLDPNNEADLDKLVLSVMERLQKKVLPRTLGELASHLSVGSLAITRTTRKKTRRPSQAGCLYLLTSFPHAPQRPGQFLGPLGEKTLRLSETRRLNFSTSFPHAPLHALIRAPTPTSGTAPCQHRTVRREARDDHPRPRTTKAHYQAPQHRQS